MKIERGQGHGVESTDFQMPDFAALLCFPTHSTLPRMETAPAVLVHTWPQADGFHTDIVKSAPLRLIAGNAQSSNQGVHSSASALCSAGFKKI